MSVPAGHNWARGRDICCDNDRLLETIVVSDVKQPLIEDILIIGYIRQSLRPEKGVKGHYARPV